MQSRRQPVAIAAIHHHDAIAREYDTEVVVMSAVIIGRRVHVANGHIDRLDTFVSDNGER
jgi:hypothetical protein